jgi:hypothetical protein
MNWNLAVEKNHEALKRILSMLIAMVGMGADGASGSSGATLSDTLPRHLHRFVLRLLRPAEAAARRLIIIAARGLVVKLPMVYERRQRPEKATPNWHSAIGIAIRPGMLPERATARKPKRLLNLSLSLLDPMKRFGIRRRQANPAVLPQIRLLGVDGPIIPFFRRPEPPPPPSPPAPSPDDPLDATSIHRRLDALRRALDDLPGQALRMARWQARRDGRSAREREGNRATPYAENASQPKRRFQRISPMRPGRPPGWRKKQNHYVYEVLNELHGLAVWARDGP